MISQFDVNAMNDRILVDIFFIFDLIIIVFMVIE